MGNRTGLCFGWGDLLKKMSPVKTSRKWGGKTASRGKPK